MCGLSGIIAYASAPVSPIVLQKATATLQHRGPETPVCWINADGTAGLGHCRLAIIDLDQRSTQPLSYQDRFQIVHNGELYNYQELRHSLEKKGYSFYTTSDTEVIVAAYAAYGQECLQQFEGMFAFAIWDEQEKKLFAARDRFGEKPFFFYHANGQLLFASEIKALWEMGAPKEVNLHLLYNFLTIDYTSNPADPMETFYTGIYKLPAASFLTFSLEKKEPTIERYWEVYPEVNTAITEPQAIEKFTALFTNSIQKRLRSDVAIGTSLSGGLDSSSIVAFCDHLGDTAYSHQTFTASFEGFERNETPFAKQVADQFHLHQHLVTMDAAAIPALMKTVAIQQEAPFISSSVLAQYKVYEAAKKHGVTVLLDGQGADEILAGYSKYFPWYWQELFRQRKLGSSGELLAGRSLGIKQPFGIQHKLAAMLPHFGAAMQERRKAKQARQQSDIEPHFTWSNQSSFYYTLPLSMDLQGVLFHNTFVYGLEELLRFADRNSMAHGVEVRLPFLDHHLVEYLFTLPSHFKIQNGWSKWLLRKTTEELLPPEIVWRKDKVGFEPPQQMWMQHPDVIDAIQEGKKRLVENGVLKPSVLQQKIKPHAAHAADNKEWKYWSASFLFS